MKKYLRASVERRAAAQGGAAKASALECFVAAYGSNGGIGGADGWHYVLDHALNLITCFTKAQLTRRASGSIT